MPHYAAFHLGLHCSPWYAFRTKESLVYKGLKKLQNCVTEFYSSDALDSGAYTGFIQASLSKIRGQFSRTLSL